MPSKIKGKGGKKHRRGKNVSAPEKIDIPDDEQYFAYVTKILGSGRVNLDYYIPQYCEKTKKLVDWKKLSKIGVIRGKMMKRVFVNLNDLVLVSERDFDDSKVDIIDKYQNHQISFLKKNTDFPNIENISGSDEFFDFEDTAEPTTNKNLKQKSNSNQDYMADIPSFSSASESESDTDL